MKFESTALSLLVAAAFCVAPAFALTGHGNAHGNPHATPATLTAVACDSDLDFFTNGGFSFFTNVTSTTNTGHGHTGHTRTLAWTGGMSGSGVSDTEDGTGVRANAANMPATSFALTVLETTVFSDPQVSFYYQTGSGFGYDSFFVNDTLNYPSYVTSTTNTDNSVNLVIDGTSATATGALWSKIYLSDFGANGPTVGAFTDFVSNFLVNGVAATPQINAHNAASSQPVEDCDM